MNNIKRFTYENSEIRTVIIESEPWWIGKDVAEVLGYSNSRKAIGDHIDDEDKGVTICDTLGGKQETTIINESGLYSLILSSKLPTAKKFKKWVTSEVLPDIRKHSMYMSAETLLGDPDVLIQTLIAYKEEKIKRIEAESRIEADKPKVAFAESVSISKTSILVGDMAKLIRQNGVDIGATRLFKWMRERGYLIKRKGNDWNMPTQKSMDLELFEIKETVISHSDGHTSINKTPKVTGKGQIYFINKFLCR